MPSGMAFSLNHIRAWSTPAKSQQWIDLYLCHDTISLSHSVPQCHHQTDTTDSSQCATCYWTWFLALSLHYLHRWRLMRARWTYVVYIINSDAQSHRHHRTNRSISAELSQHAQTKTRVLLHIECCFTYHIMSKGRMQWSGSPEPWFITVIADRISVGLRIISTFAR